MKKNEKPIIEIDPAKVKVMIHREREPVKFARVVRSIEKLGQTLPGQVRDIRGWPKEKRGEHEWELVTGEGRLQAAIALGRKFRATVEEESELKIVGFFLAENLNREALPWYEKARLVKADMDAGISPEAIAEKFFITPGHVAKFRRILDKTASGLEAEIGGMSMNEAEALTALPADGQSVVMEVFQEVGRRDLKTLTRHAARLAAENKALSPTALKESIKRVADDLKAIRAELHVVRLHHAIGPQNLRQLLQSKPMRTALKKAKVNIATFEGSKS